MAARRKNEREEKEEERQARESILRIRWRWKDIDANPTKVFVEWAERYLKIPEGPKIGEPFLIPKWQQTFIRNFLKFEIQEAGLSIARKNGKTGLIAALVLCHLCGPFNSRNWRGTVVSIDGQLAKEMRRAIELTAEASNYSDDIRVYKSPTPGRIVGRNNATVDLLNAGIGAGHARGSDLAIIDEAGLLQESDRDLWSAIYTSISGRNGKLVCISIRGDGPMFSELEARKDDTGVYWMEFTSDPDASISSKREWHKANPGLRDGIKSLAYMERAAVRALRTPADEAKFRSLDLNQPQDPERSTIVSVDAWRACMTETPPERQGEAYVGVDLGLTTSMCAAACYWPASGRLECAAAFPGEPSLKRRGEIDGVDTLYQQMERRGELRTWPGEITPVAPFLKWFSRD